MPAPNVNATVTESLGDMTVDPDFRDPLDEEGGELPADAARRAVGSDRTTVHPRDL